MPLAEDLRYLVRLLRHPNKAVFAIGALVSGLGRQLPGSSGRATVSLGRRIMFTSPTNRRAVQGAVRQIQDALVEEQLHARTLDPPPQE